MALLGTGSVISPSEDTQPGADPPPLPQHPAWRLCGLPTICSFCRQNRDFPLFSPLLQFEYEGVLVPPLRVPNSGGFQGSTWWDTAPATAPQRPWDLLRRLPAAVQPSLSHLTPRTPVPAPVGGHPAHPPSFGTSLMSPPQFSLWAASEFSLEALAGEHIAHYLHGSHHASNLSQDWIQG